MKSDYTMEFVWIMAEYKACPYDAVDNLMQNKAMRSLVSKHAERLKMIMDAFRDAQT